MSVSLTADQTDRVTLGVANELVELILDKSVRTVRIGGFDAAGTTRATCFIARTGNDGAAIGTDYETVGAGDEPRTVRVAGRARNLSGTSLYIASGDLNAIVEVATSSK